MAETIAIFSDVHGNLPALGAVLADIHARGITRAYCLGDLVGYGADPNGVIDLIRSRGIPTIIGNYDEGVAWEKGDCGCFYPNEEAKGIGDASYAFTVAIVTPERKAFLRGLPRELHVALADKRIHLVHGSPRRVNEYLLRDRDERTFLRLAAREIDDVLVFGHTHQTWHRAYGDVLFVNVGSVGKPKEGDSRAGYVLLFSAEGRPVEVEGIQVGYDMDAAADAILAAGLPATLADSLRKAR